MKTIDEYDVWVITNCIGDCPHCGELTHIEEDENNKPETCTHCKKQFHILRNLENMGKMRTINEDDICTLSNYICRCPNCGKTTQIDYKNEYIEKCEHCIKQFKIKR